MSDAKDNRFYREPVPDRYAKGIAEGLRIAAEIARDAPAPPFARAETSIASGDNVIGSIEYRSLREAIAAAIEAKAKEK